jgi:hypothetical protein
VRGRKSRFLDHPIRLNPAELWAGGEKVLAHFHLGRSAILPVSIFAGS